MEQSTAIEVGIAIAAGALLVVAGATAVGPRLRIPAPLILVVAGIAVSALPFVEPVQVAPELVLAGILPPLLYAASASLPAMDLRREFGTVSVLSVVLVVVSSLVLGLVFTLLIPGLAYGWGVALGAVISPTDAVATTIVKQTGASHRITAILEGESLLNDASALVILRAAITGAGAAGGISAGAVTLQFVWAVVGAAIIGAVVGRLSVRLRARVTDATVSTLISFTVPFAASVPAELLGASGLVAAVVAGLVVGRRAPRLLRPQHRQNDRNTFSTISVGLEGAIFLLMGLQIPRAVMDAGTSVGAALGLAVVAVLLLLVVRAAFVAPLLGLLARKAARGPQSRERVEEMRRQLEAGEPVMVRTPVGREKRFDVPRGRRAFDRQRFQDRITEVLADLDYLTTSRLGPREGAVLVWAGMRGAVTVAAAQTIPEGTGGPGTEVRALLILTAFGVAAVSLLLQGGTLALLVRLVKPAADDPEQQREEQAKVLRMVRDTAEAVTAEPGESRKQHQLRRLQASRGALLDARDLGVYDSAVLGHALETVDSGQITLEMQGGPDG